MTEAIIASAVALTVGVVWAIRQTGVLPDRFVPIGSLLAGGAWAYLFGSTGADIATDGVMIGLMASGAWSGGKTLIQG